MKAAGPETMGFPTKPMVSLSAGIGLATSVAEIKCVPHIPSLGSQKNGHYNPNRSKEPRIREDHRKIHLRVILRPVENKKETERRKRQGRIHFPEEKQDIPNDNES